MRRHSLFTVLVRVVGVFDSQETAKAAFSEFEAKVLMHFKESLLEAQMQRVS